MLVLPYGGKKRLRTVVFYFTQKTIDKEALATVVAYVVKQGPLCYGDKDKYGEEKVVRRETVGSHRPIFWC